MDMLASDQIALLASLDSKLAIIRDRVRGVAAGYYSGLYLFGEGGVGKSHAVESTLQAMARPYLLSNTRITGKGLFELLRDFPDVIHVVEDAEPLLADKNSHGVLRSALWAQDKQDRIVSWTVGGSREIVIFTGGLILTANLPLDNIPALGAIKTRIPYLQFRPTNEEVAAKMREIAARGHRHRGEFLPPAACREVAEAIIDGTRRLNNNLDIRLLICGFQDRLQWASGTTETHWRGLLESRLKERAVRVEPVGATQKEQELALVRRIADLPPPERLLAWQTATRRSRATLYRLLDEINRGASHVSG